LFEGIVHLNCRTRKAFLHLSYSYAPPCGPALLVTQDPSATLAVHRGNGFDAGFEPSIKVLV
jgi:hypothetical protein